jgi:methylated-DNA-[protein]-cysteine S-methyltransferase
LIKVEKTREKVVYDLIPSSFGTAAVVRRRASSEILAVFLPRYDLEIEGVIAGIFAAASPSGEARSGVAHRIARFLSGEPTDLSDVTLVLDGLTHFSRQVLETARRIGWGKVMTYGGLASASGHPAAARAVGRVLAANPFPLIIPCHRIIRADGTLGGFGGGVALKEALLSQEGVAFGRDGRVQRGFILSPDRAAS